MSSQETPSFLAQLEENPPSAGLVHFALLLHLGLFGLERVDFSSEFGQTAFGAAHVILLLAVRSLMLILRRAEIVQDAAVFLEGGGLLGVALCFAHLPCPLCSHTRGRHATIFKFN